MTSQELALLALLPEKWQDILLGYEAEVWFRNRSNVKSLANGFRRNGGSISIKPTAINPESLPEPLRSRVLNLDFYYRNLQFIEIKLGLDPEKSLNVLLALQEAGIDSVAQWRESSSEERNLIPNLETKYIQALDQAIQQHIRGLILSSLFPDVDE
jgi:hypothetical protein